MRKIKGFFILEYAICILIGMIILFGICVLSNEAFMAYKVYDTQLRLASIDRQLENFSKFHNSVNPDDVNFNAEKEKIYYSKTKVYPNNFQQLLDSPLGTEIQSNFKFVDDGKNKWNSNGVEYHYDGYNVNSDKIDAGVSEASSSSLNMQYTSYNLWAKVTGINGFDERIIYSKGSKDYAAHSNGK